MRASSANAFPASPNKNEDVINVAEQLSSLSSKKLNHMASASELDESLVYKKDKSVSDTELSQDIRKKLQSTEYCEASNDLSFLPQGSKLSAKHNEKEAFREVDSISNNTKEKDVKKSFFSDTGESLLTDYAESNPREYPQGFCTLVYENNECYNGKEPVIGWAGMRIGGRTKIYMRKFKCLGIYKCPMVDCYFVEKPRNPRFGCTKYSSKGGVPPSTKICPVHDWSTELITCNVKWVVSKEPESDKFMVTSYGYHKHIPPPPTKASAKAMSKLVYSIKNNPEILATQLQFGKGKRLPFSSVHPAFANKDRLAYLMRQLKEKSISQFTNNPVGKMGKGEDAIFELVRQIQNVTKQTGFLTKSIITDSCFGGESRSPFIAFCTDGMTDLLKEGFSTMQTDTIEGFAESIFFKEK